MNSVLSQPTLYRAPFVVPVTSPPIADGGVLVDNGRIVAVDRFTHLRQESARLVDVENGILAPALINCHAHLELSYLEGATAHVSESGDFTDWIRALLTKRAQSISIDEIIESGRKGLAHLHQTGVALVADIGNLVASREIGVGGRAECFFYRELLSVTLNAAEKLLSTLSDTEQYSAHSPYSCHPLLLTELKKRSRQSSALFPIHVAESADENTFLRTGTGPFHDFLIERLKVNGLLDDNQKLGDVLPHPGCGAIEYLHLLGVLDGQTICVHTVHASDEELSLLAKARAKVCLCPASNRKLNVGIAQVPLMLKHHIVVGLGTDSLASNDCLSLWNEMKILQEDHSEINPDQIFAMATFGGASTLGVADRLGSLSPGCEARMLAIDFSGRQSDIFPFLVSTGTAQKVTWLEDL